jgi:DNA-binding response OmpR family regulator
MHTQILVIDDDKGITDLLGTLLISQGFEVLAANSGEEGIRIARETSPK